MTAQFQDLMPARRIPDLHPAGAADGEGAAVRAKAHAPGTKARIRPAVDRLPGPRVADAHGMLAGGPGEPRPVGTIGDVVDLAAVAGEDRLIMVLQVPDHHGSIPADRGQVTAVEVEGDGVH